LLLRQREELGPSLVEVSRERGEKKGLMNRHSTSQREKGDGLPGRGGKALSLNALLGEERKKERGGGGRL